MSTSASNASVEFDFKKIIKSVLKKNQDALSVAELRNKVVEKIVKKSEQTIDAKIVAKLFDKSVFASLNTADFIQLN
ncbi:hypothetical protein HK100_010256 [Physocladia obscura]|uniref:Uncharacterized protein n=1 Tax=Physocladia obscura TaxID=109957 RepID=A0AAD5T9Q5_9FUNG|nr:hypothetical protein HK100_010256 [Physocladia obscura]